ncbi:MAG: hypothetical protein HGA98_03965 [Deltaproteobacteria bacterium]|nr:hypothetical protein [Deltaproteobacteria bacterium]
MKREVAFRLVPLPLFGAEAGGPSGPLPGFTLRNEATGALVRADVWCERPGELVARFSGGERWCHFRVEASPPELAADEMSEELEEFLFGRLIVWAVEGGGEGG